MQNALFFVVFSLHWTGQPGEQMDENNLAETNGDATGKNGGEGQPQEQKFTQADVDRIIADRLGKEKQKSAEQQRKAAEEAAAKALAEQGEFKTLAEKNAARVAELEAMIEGSTVATTTQAAELERYKATLQSYVKAQRKGVPEHITQLLDALDLAGQLDWLSKNADKIQAGMSGVPPLQRQGGNVSDAQKKAYSEHATQLYRSNF